MGKLILFDKTTLECPCVGYSNAFDIVRINIESSSSEELNAVFSNPEKTKVFAYELGNEELHARVFYDYTNLLSIEEVEPDFAEDPPLFLVRMGKPEEE